MSLNSPFAKAFLATMARIQDQVTAIKHIDQDMGQLDGNSSRPAVAFPCILMDFQNFQYSNIQKGAQVCEGDVIIKLAFAQFTPSSDKVDDVYREIALEYYDIEWELNKALHAWSPGDEFGYYTRTGVVAQNIAEGIRVRTLTYRLEFEDYSTQVNDTVVYPDFGFIGKLNKPV